MHLKETFNGRELKDIAIQQAFEKEHGVASRILLKNSMNIQQSHLENMPED